MKCVIVFLLGLLPATFSPAVPTQIHAYASLTSVSPNREWTFHVAGEPDSDVGARLSLTNASGKHYALGRLERDGRFYWCPNEKCLLVVEDPSIERTSIQITSLSALNAQPIQGLNAKLHSAVLARIGGKSTVLFYGISVLGWLGSDSAVIAVQARYVPSGENAPAQIETVGFVLRLPSGAISRELSERELAHEYGFTGRIV